MLTCGAMLPSMMVRRVGFNRIEPGGSVRLECYAVRSTGFFGRSKRSEFVDMPHDRLCQRGRQTFLDDHTAAWLSATFRRVFNTPKHLGVALRG
jgi:hypothetical protein